MSVKTIDFLHSTMTTQALPNINNVDLPSVDTNITDHFNPLPLSSIQATLSGINHTQNSIRDILNTDISNIDIKNPPKSYYTIDDYNKLSYEHNEIKIISLNINSLRKHINELNVFVKRLKCKPDIIILQEIRCNVDEILNIHFKDFKHYIDYPKNNKCGGVAILVNNKLKSDNLPSQKINSVGIENVVIEISTKNHRYVISGIYKHPHKDNTEFIDLIIKQSRSISKNTCYILAGDINIDLLKYNDSVQIRNIFDKLNINRLNQIVNAPTRITKNSQTIIDHIYLKSHNKLEIKTGILLESISDHLCNFVNVKIHNKLDMNNRPKVQLINKKNMSTFKEKIININNLVLNANSNDSEYLWNLFLNNIKEAYNISFPIVKISRKKFKDKDWITECIKKSAKTKENLYKIWTKNKTPFNENKYKTYKAAYVKVIKKAKENYYKNILENDKTNKTLWKEVRKCNGKNNRDNSIDKIKTNNIVYSDNKDIANALNLHFSTIGEKMGVAHQINGDSFHKFLPDRTNQSINLIKTTNVQIQKIIEKLHNKTSAGEDNISQKLVKSVKHIIIPTLVKLINASIIEKKYPDCLKTAKVIPIFKAGSTSDSNNYRPISLLSTFNKIFEKKIQADLVKFIEKNDILYEKQYGFRKYHSTIDALISTHDYIIEQKRKKTKIIGIFIDLKKAFDSIDNSILLQKLENYGISGPYNMLLKSYLTNRKIYTNINDVSSNKMEINYGVPQGSVLGPILFNLYINDIKSIAKKYEINLFADDTSLFITAKTYRELETKANIALKELNNWLSANRLTLNVQKTHYIDFSTKKDSEISLKISDKQIERVKETKYLGIILQENLKWEKQISSIITKLNKQIPLYYALKTIFSVEKLNTVYKALSLSLINYGIELYGRKNTIWLKQLQKTQNRLLKILLSKPRISSTNSIHKVLKILKVKDLADVRNSLVIHKFIHQKENLNETYKELKSNNDIHSRNTRNRDTTIHITANFNLYQNKVIEEASLIWNSLNQNIRSINTRTKFKLFIENTKIENY